METRHFLKSLIYLGLVLSTSVLADEAKKPEYKTYLTNQVINNQPTTEQISKFDCSDRIYLVVEGKHLKPGKHQLKVKWVNPAGSQQELTRYDFEGFAYTRIWAWLQLNGPTAAVIGQIFDPAFGMEDFIGKWSAEVRINRKSINNLEFDVLC